MAVARPLQGLTVLVLDDDFYMADEVRQTVVNGGAVVLGPYPRLAQALAGSEAKRPDCAIVDVNLGSGPDFAAAQAFSDMSVAVVFYTGYDCSVIPTAFSHLACLQKPMGAGSIVSAIGKACGR
jgi:FixJ family two-component response regulator